MQKRAGLLFLSRISGRILLIQVSEKWTVPTFARYTNVLEDTKKLIEDYSVGRILPIELYLSEDKGFEYGTYVCLVDAEFLTTANPTIAWCDLDELPKNLHVGLKTTLNNSIIRTKIQTILELENATIKE
jgi:hypothetical protein